MGPIPTDHIRFASYCFCAQNTDEENRELLSYLDPDDSGYIDWVQWVTELLFVLDLEKSGQSTQENKVVCVAYTTS